MASQTKGSSGPKTSRGKSRSSKNALKHGLSAVSVLLPAEDADEFVSFERTSVAALEPQGPIEAALAERVALSIWRLRRVARIEAGILDYESEDAWMFAKASNGATAEQKTNARLGLGVSRNANGSDALTKLSRYETAIERSMYRALHELQRLQAMRAGVEVSPPLAVEIGVSGA